MNAKRIALSVLLLFGFSAYSAAASKQWLHVHVDSDKDEKVRVNLPLSLVSSVLPILEEKHLGEAGLRHGKVHIGGQELSVEDIRKIWQSVKQEGAFELASVMTTDANVRVSIDDRHLLVTTQEPEGANVNVQIPVEVVDALLSGEGEELNLVAAVEALQQLGSQQLVMVEADDAKVRVWIDESNN